MSHARNVLHVAAWEFRRYFKWKDQLVGLGFFVLVSALGVGVGMVAGAKGRTMTVGLAGLELEAPKEGRLRFVEAPPEGEVRLAALREGDLAGVLGRRPDGAFELLVEKDPRFLSELRAVLDGRSRREKLSEEGLSEEALSRVLSPAPLDVRYLDPGRERRGRAEKVAAGVFVGILLMAVFTSLAYVLTGITGEKQLRVTESVVSAISPQAWIDGKVLGIAAYSLTTVANLLVGGAILSFGAKAAFGFSLPAAAVRPGVLLALVTFTGLGLLLWNSFFAAVASTIDDPNTSARSSLLFLPMIPVIACLAILRDPDSLVSRILALFPLTSAPGLPVRLVLSDPGAFEIGASAALLLGAIWLTRRLAGRVFEVGMLLYGKEPSWREIARWASP